MNELADRVAIVTGAASGIGESMARRLFAGGASVVLAGHDEAGLQAVVRDLDAGGRRTRIAVGDVRDPAFMAQSVALAVREFEGLHLAVNNAGVTGPHGTLLEDLSPSPPTRRPSMPSSGSRAAWRSNMPTRACA